MTDSVVVEGYARLRDGKKWKTRWLVLRKPSPVADCLLLLAFKDKSDKAQGHKERAGVTLEEICGLEAGQWYEGVAFTLSILCLNQAALLGFDSKETLQAWDARLRYNLGEVHSFSVGVLPGTKLESGPATLHLCNNLLALARDVPPVVVSHWNLPDLRRYGPIPNGFVFEGGTRCGYWAGVFLLASPESEQISFLFDCIVRGISPTRGPFGLRPILPDPSASQADSEERLNHEARELEKRLSMLSHRSSTASYCPSVGGDDRSISGSSDASDTSQSDSSVGSRLAMWTEPTAIPPDGVGHAGAKAATLQSVEKLSANQGGGNWPAAKPPRQLQEIGRQSSSDSGIATGSHSSYSGSFSSYTGSLDITPGEDFGSVFSLPPHLAQDLSPCTCLTAHGHEYQVPTSLRYLYDTPRSLLQEGGRGARDVEASTPTEDTPPSSGLPTVSAKEDNADGVASEGRSESTDRQSVSEHLQEEIKKDKAESDPGHTCSAVSKTIVTICSVCGGFRKTKITRVFGQKLIRHEQRGREFITLSGAPYIPSAVPAIPERHSFNPADQNVDKSPWQPNTMPLLEKSLAAPGSGSVHGLEKPPVRTSEDSPRPKKGREKLAGLSLDLSGFPSADWPPENRMALYESMSPRFGREVKFAPAGTYVPSLDSQRDQRAAIYENCFKCQGKHCQPPPRVAPAATYHSGNFPSSDSIPAGPGLRNVQEAEAAVSEGPLCEDGSDGSQNVGVQRQLEEMNGQTVTREDKKFHSKEERRRADPAYEIMDSRAPEKNLEVEEKSKYELMGGCGQQRLLQETEEAALLERPRGEGATYVNIPVSPTSKKQLNYMELELQEPGPSARGTPAHLPPARRSSSKYAQIDIAATETAHKVGTKHALGRQEGLHTLELRRKGTPH